MKEYFLDPSIPRRSSSARPVIIVQARMGSTRLPGKVLLPMNGIPMLQGMLTRLSSLQRSTPILLATTSLPQDTPLVELGLRCAVEVFRGSEEDVLDRFAKAVATTDADTVVRLSGDCPLTDPHMVDSALDLFYHLSPDFLSNTLHRTYPRGFDIEIFTRTALETAAKEATLHAEREHVTPFIISHPDRFSCVNFAFPEDLSAWRLTVDTKEDFILVERFLSHLTERFSFEEVRRLLQQHPDWQRLNAHVKQKMV